MGAIGPLDIEGADLGQGCGGRGLSGILYTDCINFVVSNYYESLGCYASGEPAIRHASENLCSLPLCCFHLLFQGQDLCHLQSAAWQDADIEKQRPANQATQLHHLRSLQTLVLPSMLVFSFSMWSWPRLRQLNERMNDMSAEFANMLAETLDGGGLILWPSMTVWQSSNWFDSLPLLQDLMKLHINEKTVGCCLGFLTCILVLFSIGLHHVFPEVCYAAELTGLEWLECFKHFACFIDEVTQMLPDQTSLSAYRTKPQDILFNQQHWIMYEDFFRSCYWMDLIYAVPRAYRAHHILPCHVKIK